MANIQSSTTAQSLMATYNNVAPGSTISSSTGAAAISNAFTLGYDPTLVNNGIIIGRGNVSGVQLSPGDGSFHTIIQNDGGATITGGDGVVLVGTLGFSVYDTAASPTAASIVNNGVITGTGTNGGQASGEGILFETAVRGAISNNGGVITGTQYGVIFRGLGNFGDYVNNSGSISGGSKGIVFDNISFTNTGGGLSTRDVGTGTLINTGIVGSKTEASGVGVEFDTGNQGAVVVNAGTIFGAVNANQGGILTVQDNAPFSATITGGANFGSNSMLNLNGTGGIGTAANYIGFSTINITNGSDFQLSAPGTSATFTGNSVINNSGTVLVGGAIYDSNGGVVTTASINMEASLAIATTIDFTGSVSTTPIYDFGGNDDIILSSSALPTEGALSSDTLTYNTATGVLTVNETSAAGAVSTAFVTISEPNNYSSGSFVGLQGAGGLNIVLNGAQLGSNTGSLVIDRGNQVALTNVALDNVPVTFGSNATALSQNVLLLNGINQSVNGGAYYAENTGKISGFGTNDIITLGTTNLGALPTDVLTTNYDTTTGKLQIFDQSEYQRTGNFNLSTDAVFFSPAGSYSAGSFVETYGTNGLNIETAATDAEQGYTFNAGTGTADINTLLDYSGLVAPGSSIVSGEVVTIASGTATFAVTTAEGSISSFVNSGTILVSGAGSTFSDAATLTGGGTIIAANGGQININSATGTDAAQTLQFGTASSSLTNTIDLNPTSGTFAGTIAGFGANDSLILGPKVLPTVSGGSATETFNPTTGVLTVNELNAGGTIVGTSTVTLSGDGSLSSLSFMATQGPNGVTITAPNSIFIDNGRQVTLTNTAITTIPVTFGTHGSVGAPNVLDLNGSSQAVPGTGYYGSETGSISGFGMNDIITLGTNAIASQPNDVLTTNYDTTTGAYQIFDQTAYQRNPNYATSTDVVYFSPAGSYSASSFVETYGTNGINIETPATDAAQGYTFNASGTGTADINTVLDYSGLVAPGSSIVTGEVVTIASGTATFAAANTVPIPGSTFVSSLVNSGTILVSGPNAAFTDYATLTGAGTVVAANGGHVTIASATGTDAAQTLQFGTGGTSLAFNTIDLNPTSGTFGGTIAGFGLNDDIIIGPSTLPSLATGSSVTLAYAGSVLTVGEVNSGGTVTATTTLNVGTGYSVGSFVALIGTNGINIETPATVDEQSFTFQSAFNTTGSISQLSGNFEDPTLYKGRLAPGSSIVSGETVTVLPTSLAQLTTPLNNSGVIILNGFGANLVDSVPVTGNGTIFVNGGAEFVATNTLGATTNTIAFGPTVSGATDIIYLDGTGTSSFAGVIANFGPGDNIDLGSSFLPTPTSASNIALSFSNGLLTVFDTVNGTVYTDTLTIAGTVPGNFSATIGGMGIIISDIPCFAAGTRILTGNGQVAVQDIAVGDKVLTVRDGAEAEVVWVGQRTVDITRHAMPEKVRPIRILAGAFGEGLPERDLRLSPDHALFIDGHLIEAKTLVNGVTVIEEMATRFVTYHHVELANHDIMLAEGLAAESYLDSGNRMMFESDAAPMMLHPDFAAVSRVKACAPLVTDGDVVMAARTRLLERAAALGFVATGAIDLTVHVAGTVIAPEMGGEELLFVLPRGAASVALVSSVGVPAETSAAPGDRRSLGVAVTGLALIVGGKRMVISLEDPAHSGFYGMEAGHRWTNGAARIALPAYTGKAVLEVTINGQATRWVTAA